MECTRRWGKGEEQVNCRKLKEEQEKKAGWLVRAVSRARLAVLTTPSDGSISEFLPSFLPATAAVYDLGDVGRE